MNRVVITGPTGAIGVALIEELIIREIEVIAVVRPKSKRKDNVPVYIRCSTGSKKNGM